MRDLDKYMIPFWEGNVIEDESCFVMENEAGELMPINLLYKADKVLKVTDQTLKVTYEEGKDYVVEDGRIIILPEGKIPVMKSKDFFLDEQVEGKSFIRRNDKWLAFGEWVLMYPYFITVTYTHSEKWDRFIPESRGEKLPNFIKKLENKEPVKIVVYGDSICCGANATSLKDMEPNLPKWDEYIVRELSKKYGYSDIEVVNNSVGGKNAAWGAEEVYERAAKYKGDLVIVGFGMNDGATTFPNLKDSIVTICDAVRKENKDSDIILLATMCPNSLLKGFWGNQPYQQYAFSVGTFCY